LNLKSAVSTLHKRRKLIISIAIVLLLILLSVAFFLVVVNSNKGDDKKEGDQTGEQEEDLGYITNEDMRKTLQNEVDEIKSEYLSEIFPPPDLYPEKFYTLFLPQPNLWREVLANIDEFKKYGFNSVHFGPLVILDSDDCPRVVGEDLVKFYINEFHRSGMHVILTTNPAGPWGEFFSEEREDWSEEVKKRHSDGTLVEEYTERIIFKWAQVAEEYNVAAFIPANEIQMISTDRQYLKDKAPEILSGIRERYSGKVGFNIQMYGDTGWEGGWTPLHYEYELSNYDFVLPMGDTSRVESYLGYELDTENLIKKKIACIEYFKNFIGDYSIDEIWYGFGLYGGGGNWWEPIQDDEEMIVNALQASVYADNLLSVIHDDVACVTAVYDYGFMVLDEPIPEVWVQYFTPTTYSPPIDDKIKWNENDLYHIQEALFPQWDSLYGMPMELEERIESGYQADLQSNGDVNISGEATYLGDWIQIVNFSFDGDGRDIELRIGDDRLEDKFLVNVARLKDIGENDYDDEELRLDMPDWFGSIVRDYRYNFICLLIYDNDNRKVLGKYYFYKPL